MNHNSNIGFPSEIFAYAHGKMSQDEILATADIIDDVQDAVAQI